jgi:hypothetical protein
MTRINLIEGTADYMIIEPRVQLQRSLLHVVSSFPFDNDCYTSPVLLQPLSRDTKPLAKTQHESSMYLRVFKN